MDKILLINKDIGITSQGVVSRVKKLLNEPKAGHTGTLDPMASGVLPILLGKATKLSKYFVEHNKRYIATLLLDKKSSTGDLEGQIIANKAESTQINKEKVEEVLNSFIGKQKQTPSIYSAIKVNGKKLYEYARSGEEVDIPEREIEIYDIKLIDIDYDKKEITFEAFVSKGTYIRTLCEDIAEKLGTVGMMVKLVRTTVNDFKIEDSITLEELENNLDNVDKYLIDPEMLFKSFGRIDLDERKKELFYNGVKLTYELEDGLYNIYSDNKYLGLGIVKEKLLKRDILFI